MNRYVRISMAIIGVFVWVHISQASETVSQVTAQDAMKLLQEGNDRFVSGSVEHPNSNQARRDETSVKGQSPFVAILACADSRVPVELIFDRGIGDIFTVRVAGNVAADGDVGSLDYAVEHLHVPLIVIMGHTKCGAVTAAVSGAQVEGKLKTILDLIAPAAEKAKAEHAELQGTYLVEAAIRENINQAYKDLLAKSPVVKDALAKGHVKVAGALYNIYTGKVEWIDVKA